MALLLVHAAALEEWCTALGDGVRDAVEIFTPDEENLDIRWPAIDAKEQMIAADEGGVLTDTARKYERIELTQGGIISPDVFLDTVTVHLDCQQRQQRLC